MAVYLDEEFVGSDPNEIIYPRLLLCMSVTCLMSDGRLFGAHIGEATYEDAVLAGLKSRIAAQLLKPAMLYIIGDQAGAAKNVQQYQPPPRNAFQNTAVYKTGHTTNTPVAALTDHDFVSLIV
jgi:hypothetical protein